MTLASDRCVQGFKYFKAELLAPFLAGEYEEPGVMIENASQVVMEHGNLSNIDISHNSSDYEGAKVDSELVQRRRLLSELSDGGVASSRDDSPAPLGAFVLRNGQRVPLDQARLADEIANAKKKQVKQATKHGRRLTLLCRCLTNLIWPLPLLRGSRRRVDSGTLI